MNEHERINVSRRLADLENAGLKDGKEWLELQAKLAPPVEKKCKTCAAWQAVDRASSADGECHGSTPSAGKKAEAVWPVTLGTEWCRQWEKCDG